jgi:hypothetical protein
MEKPPAQTTITPAEAERPRFANPRLLEQLALDLVEEWISAADELLFGALEARG